MPFLFIQGQNIPLVEKAITGKLTKAEYMKHFKMSDFMLTFNSIDSIKLVDIVDDFYVIKFSFLANSVDSYSESLEILDRNGLHISSNSFSHKSGGHDYSDKTGLDSDDIVEATYYRGGFIRTKSYSINGDGIEREYYISVIDSIYYVLDIEIDTLYLENDKFKSLEEKTKTELRLLRNEVFARNGHSFTDPFLKKYFKNQKWYVDSGRMKIKTYMLTQKEQELVSKIWRLENAK